MGVFPLTDIAADYEFVSMCVNHQFVDDAQLKVKTEQPLVEFSNSFIVYCLFAEKYNLELCLIL